MMMQKKPRFSVIVPAYNREKLIHSTVNSILGQEFKDFEAIVVDDGSKDRTAEFLHSFGDRIKTIVQANQGAETARARGALEATGEYLVFLDDDDLLLPWSLAVYDRIIREMGSPPLILGDMSYFEDGAPPPSQGGDEKFIEVLKYADYYSKEASLGLSCSRVVMQKSVYDASAKNRNNFSAYPHDDHHLMLSVGTCTPCVLVTRPTTVAHRIHANNFSRNVDLIVQRVVSLIEFERQGFYPGGVKRIFGRYSCIGGIAWFWARRGIQHGHYARSARLLLRSSPHLAAGAIKKIMARLRTNAIPMRFQR